MHHAISSGRGVHGTTGNRQPRSELHGGHIQPTEAHSLLSAMFWLNLCVQMCLMALAGMSILAKTIAGVVSEWWCRRVETQAH